MLSYHRGGTTVPVLDDINLVVEEGEFLALMGPSGSGKSTLHRVIATFLIKQGGAQNALKRTPAPSR